MTGRSTRLGGVTPVPTDEEMAAIAAAVEANWPQPLTVSEQAHRATTWRFSSRWWAKPIASRRDRPYR